MAVMPKYVARAGRKRDFDAHGLFAPAGPFVFVTEPVDLAGTGPLEALRRVGWTADAARESVGEDIEVCVLDTHAPIENRRGEAVAVELRNGNWRDLWAAAAADTVFRADVEATHGIDEARLAEVFEVLQKTPVGAPPKTRDDRLYDDALAVRRAMHNFFGATFLYSGIGAVVQEHGELGGRELMLGPNEAGLVLTEENHVRVDLGVLDEVHVASLETGWASLGRTQRVSVAEGEAGVVQVKLSDDNGWRGGEDRTLRFSREHAAWLRERLHQLLRTWSEDVNVTRGQEAFRLAQRGRDWDPRYIIQVERAGQLTSLPLTTTSAEALVGLLAATSAE